MFLKAWTFKLRYVKTPQLFFPADACDLQQSLDLRSTGQGTCTRVVTDGPLLEVAMYDEPDPLIPYVHRISSTRCWRDFETRG